TNALHEAHRVPVEVVVDQPGSVLEVETFGQHVGRDENADFLVAQGSAGALVVVGRKPLDQIDTLAAGSAVYLAYPLDPSFAKLLGDIARGIAEFGEDEHLVLGQDRVLREQLD